MATTLASQYAAAVNNADFLNRITVALGATAQAISTEATTTVNHVNRVALMRAIATGPAQYAPLFALLLVGQGIDDTSTDAQILSMISAVWNTMAGVP